MFKPLWGARLDYNFSRFKNAPNSTEFKVNYSRVNAQLVFDATPILSFSKYFGVETHAGLGLSFVSPLNQFKDNKRTYLNAIAGLEFNYQVAKTFSVFLDTSYILGFGTKTYDPVSEGFGAFHGNVLTVTAGVSLSLSGCYYCD